MLAQDRHEDSNITGQSAPRRQSRRPTKFMFIDSSNGGVNAKPDRKVRSFVMKSARNRKTWSTRPKSPREEELVEAPPKEHLPCHTNVQHESTFAAGSRSSHDYRRDSAWDDYPLASQASSRCGSIFSTYSSSRTCDSPLSSYTSPFAEHGHSEHPYDFPLGQQTVVTLRDGLNTGLADPFDCLSVHLDAHTQQLLNQCKQKSRPHNSRLLTLSSVVEGSAPRLIPVDLHRSSSVAATDWIAKCIQSPNGAPYIYAALTASARAVGLNSEAYKWRAVTEVNKLLSHPSTSTDDTTIAAVLVLLALEESDLADPTRQGNDREWSLSANNAHLNGLRTMIMQRGGLAALNPNRCLQVFILM